LVIGADGVSVADRAGDADHTRPPPWTSVRPSFLAAHERRPYASGCAPSQRAGRAGRPSGQRSRSAPPRDTTSRGRSRDPADRARKIRGGPKGSGAPGGRGSAPSGCSSAVPSCRHPEGRPAGALPPDPREAGLVPDF
jgi:hypothetical protein